MTQGKHKDVTGLILQIKAKAGTVKLMSDTDHSSAIEVFSHQVSISTRKSVRQHDPPTLRIALHGIARH